MSQIKHEECWLVHGQTPAKKLTLLRSISPIISMYCVLNISNPWFNQMNCPLPWDEPMNDCGTQFFLFASSFPTIDGVPIRRSPVKSGSLSLFFAGLYNWIPGYPYRRFPHIWLISIVNVEHIFHVSRWGSERFCWFLSSLLKVTARLPTEASKLSRNT